MPKASIVGARPVNSIDRCRCAVKQSRAANSINKWRSYWFTNPLPCTDGPRHLDSAQQIIAEVGAAADAMFVQTKKSNLIVMSNEKQKDDEESLPISLELRQIDLGVNPSTGRAMKSCVLVETTDVEEPATCGPNQSESRALTRSRARKSKAWEAELAVINSERARVETPRPETMVTAEKILELAKGFTS
jgi:hypothetical protein